MATNTTKWQANPVPSTSQDALIKWFMEIFPEELWMLVISQIEGQTNLQNFTAAFPEVSNIFNRQLAKLTFKQVSSGVFEYVADETLADIKEMFDKDWCVSISNLLQRNNSTVVRQKEFHYYLPTQHVQLREIETLSTRKEVQRFYKHLNQNNSKAYEILSTKIIKIQKIQTYQDIDACVAFFTQFGNFIKTLDISFSMSKYHAWEGPIFLRRVIECLEIVPNVRRLSLEIYNVNDSSAVAQVIDLCSRYPVLTKLRELEIRGCINPVLLQYFLNGNYFRDGTIHELTLRVQDYLFPEGTSSYYAYVVEYDLSKVKCTATTVEQFEDFLRGQRQKIKFVEGWDILHLPKLFQVLSEELQLGEDLIIKSRDLTRIRCPAKITISLLPSVKYLEISDNEISDYRFLKSLPSLEYLKIIGHSETKARYLVWGWYINFLSDIIRSYLYKDSVINTRYNIWKKLPTLKSLFVQDGEIVLKHFLRSNKNTPVVFRVNEPAVAGK